MSYSDAALREDVSRLLREYAGEKIADVLAEVDRQRAQAVADRLEANNQWRLDYNKCALERDDLRAAMEKIANFAPGYGEIAERIATMARHALWPEFASMAEEEARLSSAAVSVPQQVDPENVLEQKRDGQDG